MKFLSTWCFRPRFLLILIFASYTQQKLSEVKAGEQTDFEWCPFLCRENKFNQSKWTLQGPYYSLCILEMLGDKEEFSAGHMHNECWQMPSLKSGGKAERQISKAPRTVNHSTSGTTANLLLLYTLTLWKCEVVHGPKNNPDCTEFFQISEDQDF